MTGFLLVFLSIVIVLILLAIIRIFRRSNENKGKISVTDYGYQESVEQAFDDIEYFKERREVQRRQCNDEVYFESGNEERRKGDRRKT